MSIISGKQAFKLSIIVAPLGVLFIFFTYGLDSFYERRSDDIFQAEFKSAKIDSINIDEYKGFSTDIIYVNGEKYYLNLNEDYPNDTIENLKTFVITKKANSDLIILKNIQERKELKLWTYNKTSWWVKRIIFSLFGGIFFIFIGFLNLLYDKNKKD